MTTGGGDELEADTLPDAATTSPLARPDASRGDVTRPTTLPSTTRKVRPSHPRGLFDFVLTALLLYGVYAKTPVGAIGEWAFRVFVLDQEHTPPLFATFRGRDSEVQISLGHLEKGVLASLAFPASIEEASARTRVDRELLAVLVATHGRCDGDACFVTAPPHLDDLLERPADGEVPVLDVAIGLAKGAIQLGATAEVAVEALFVPPHAVERAVGQARASGMGGAHDVEVHAAFLPPTVRRGHLQEAMSVLALYRLRTLSWPVDADKRVTSAFGYRIHPISGERRFHNGTDVGVANGTPLMSAHRGRIRRVGEDSISGKYVHIDHGFGILSTHCHMSEVRVVDDQVVERRQVVGLSGDTGRVTGPHLHYILRIDEKVVDPEAYGEAPRRHLATVDPKLLGVIPVEEAPAPAPPPKKPPPKKPPPKKPVPKKPAPKRASPKEPAPKKPEQVAPKSASDGGSRDDALGAAAAPGESAAESAQENAPPAEVRSTDGGPP